jgi:hypothetical protein
MFKKNNGVDLYNIIVGSPMRIGMSALIRGKGYAYWGYAFAVVLMES